MDATTSKKDIKSFSRDELMQWLDDMGIRPFRTDQILKWIYLRLSDSFSQMTDLRKDVRQLLDQSFTIGRLKTAKVLTSTDGSRKFLFELADGQTIESVLIPEQDHFTLCLSSQVGCAQGCKFCLTAKSGFIRNLTAAEIIGQIWEVRKQMDAPGLLTNLVFMGMGEPLANLRQLISALSVITNANWGMKISSRRITVSTAGLAPRIPELGQAVKVNLAVSLNAVDDQTRTRLMPINRKYPISALLDACRRFPLPARRKITFEYILMKDVNDSMQHASRLVNLLSCVNAKINLIPFNEYEGSDFKRPAEERIQEFQAFLIKKHFTSIVRYSKGQDIMAACGQLRGAVTKS
ncbi:MAG: 23S rRNA (adenine(2503)-C(2))-methyltransferase RlmN [Desulfobacteraceae bacterium]|nr:23S rRNA (adenine(2503)-C(2))-methyltransferase RlmN [Desulfobacteraceae bacterium]